MKIPWTGTDSRPSGTTVVQVSRLQLCHRRDVPGFLVAALRLRRTVLRSEGAIGMALLAQPLKRTFWTLSAWCDEAAVMSFVGNEQHLDVMTTYRGKMADAHFHTWFTMDLESGPPDWESAQRLLETSRGEA